NTNAFPQRWEWGTLNHECIAGIAACVEYLAELGRSVASCADRRQALTSAYEAIQSHERKLMERMLRGLKEIPSLRLFGISDPARIESRCPTFAIRIDGHTPLTRHQTRRPRHLHLGRQLLRDQSNRTSGRRTNRRLPKD